MSLLPPITGLFVLLYFIVAMVIEIIVLRRKYKKEIESRDAWANIGNGTIQFIVNKLFIIPVLLLYNYLYSISPIQMGVTWYSIVIALFANDFGFYWAHRFNHETQLGWATHVTHHSSKYYNLTVAVRQSWTMYLNFFFFIPIAFIGVPAELLLTVKIVDAVFQFWVHTETVGKLPRWFEFIFNTPSHHRVHHASNPKYLDKNYGGVFIFWDRLFRTFKEEEEKPTYGLTTNLNSHNWLVIQFHVWQDIFRGLWKARDWRTRWQVLFNKPAEVPKF